jgi:hypothetical protein
MNREQRKLLNRLIKHKTHNARLTIREAIGWTIFILVASCWTLWFQIHDFNTIENNFVQKFVGVFINVFFWVLIPLFLSYFLNSMLEKFYLITNYGRISNFTVFYKDKDEFEYDLLRDNLVRILLLIICAVIFSITSLSCILKQYYANLENGSSYYAVWDLLSAFFGFMCFWLAIIEMQKRKILTRMKNDKDLLEVLESLKVKLDPDEDGC